jgi:hypothetical protein
MRESYASRKEYNDHVTRLGLSGVPRVMKNFALQHTENTQALLEGLVPVENDELVREANTATIAALCSGQL